MESFPIDENSAPRRARESDVAALADLARLALPLGFSDRDFRDAIAMQAGGSSAVWVSGVGAERAMGGAVVQLAADEAELLWLAVHPEDRRRGLARQLLGAAVGWVDERVATLYLEVRESNVAAIALYAATGFVVTGRRARYYRDGEDALLFRRPASTPSPKASAEVGSQPPGESR